MFLRRYSIFAGIFLTRFALLPAGGQEAKDRQRIDNEIGRLSAETWRDRSEATVFLMNSGPEAEMRLRRLISQTQSPEARIRAERVLARIRSIRRTEPALLTLDVKDVKAEAAFDAVAEIEGATLPANPPGLLATIPNRATAHFELRPYWEVVLELCRQFDLELRFPASGPEIVNRTVAPASSQPAVCGLFLVRGQLSRWSADRRDPGRSVRLEIFPEPRAQLLRADWHVYLTEALDEHGQSLIPLADSGINLAGSGRRGAGYVWNVPLRPAASVDGFLSHLRGHVSVVLAEQVQTIRLPDRTGGKTLAGPMPVSLSAGGLSANILSIVSSEAAYRMDMQLSIDPAEVDWDGLLLSMGSGGLRAFDVDGGELKLLDLASDGGGPSNNVRCKWGMEKGSLTHQLGQPFKLLWEVPAKTTQVTVPFELHDVKLIKP